jgi:alpha-amylase
MITLSDIIYLIMPDRFFDGDPANNREVDLSDPLKRHGGDLMGIVKKLPYLKKLGVTTIWITPFYPNPAASYHGYHSLDFDGVESSFCSPELGPIGSRETIRNFVSILHKRGFKVMLDMVVGHCSPDHPWVKSRPEWFDAKHSTTPDKEWFFGLANINHDVLDVNIYFLRNVLIWAQETGADAIRIDAARHVESTFWQLFKIYTQGMFPNTSVIGEFWDSDPHKVAVLQNQHGFSGMFDFPLYEAMRDVFIKSAHVGRLARARLSKEELSGVLDMDPIYRSAHQLVTFIGNHDTPRFFTSAMEGKSAEEAEATMKLALLFQFTVRGVPQLYAGDELGMEGGADPDNRRDFPWHLLEKADATPEARRARRMLAYTRKLIQLRSESAALRWGYSAPLYVMQDVYVYARMGLEELAIAAFNLGSEPKSFEIPIRENENVPTSLRVRIKDQMELLPAIHETPPLTVKGGQIQMTIPPRTGELYKARFG